MRKIAEVKIKDNVGLYDHYLANIFRGRIEYELTYSLRSAKQQVDYSVPIPWGRETYLLNHILQPKTTLLAKIYLGLSF